MELGSWGARCGRVGVEEWSSGALEARRRRARRGGMEFRNSGSLKVHCGFYRCRGVEVWIAEGVLRVLRRGSVDVRGLEARCRWIDVDAWRYGGVG